MRRALTATFLCALMGNPTAWAQERLDAAPRPMVTSELILAPLPEAVPHLEPPLPLVSAIPALTPDTPWFAAAAEPSAARHPVMRMLHAQGARALALLKRLRGGRRRGERLWTLAARPFIGDARIQAATRALALAGEAESSLRPLARFSIRPRRASSPPLPRVSGGADRATRHWRAAAYAVAGVGAWLLQHFGLLPEHAAHVIQLAAVLPPFGPTDGGDLDYDNLDRRIAAGKLLLAAYLESAPTDDEGIDGYAIRLLKLLPANGLTIVLYHDREAFEPLIERMKRLDPDFLRAAERQEAMIRQRSLEEVIGKWEALDPKARAERIAEFAASAESAPLEQIATLLARNPERFAPIIEQLRSRNEEFARLWSSREDVLKRTVLPSLWRKAASEKERMGILADLAERARGAADDDVVELVGDGPIAGALAGALAESRPALAERLRGRGEIRREERRREILLRKWGETLDSMRGDSDEKAARILGALEEDPPDTDMLEIIEALAAERPGFARMLTEHPAARERANKLRERADALMEVPASKLVRDLYQTPGPREADRELIAELMERRPDLRDAMIAAWKDELRELARRPPASDEEIMDRFFYGQAAHELTGKEIVESLLSADGQEKYRVLNLATTVLNEMLPDFEEAHEQVLRQLLKENCRRMLVGMEKDARRLARKTRQSYALYLRKPAFQTSVMRYVETTALMDLPQEYVAEVLYGTQADVREFALLIRILKSVRADFADAASQQEVQWAYLARLRKR